MNGMIGTDEVMTVDQVFSRLAAAILSVNDNTTDRRQREMTRRTVLDQIELAHLRLLSSFDVIEKCEKDKF